MNTSNDIKIFRSAGRQIVFDQSESEFISNYSIFVRLGFDFQMEFMERYSEEIHCYDDLYTTAFYMLSEYVNQGFEIGVEVLIDNGIDFINPDYLKKIFVQNYDLYEILQDYFEGIERIAEFEEENSRTKELYKESRPRWKGYGIGIKGAISSAIKADMLNIATDMVCGIGDLIALSGNKYELSRLKEDIFKNSQAGQCIQLASSIIINCIGSCVMTILDKEINLETPKWWDSDRVKGKIDNTLTLYKMGRYSEQKVVDNLFECIQNAPYSELPYYTLYDFDDKYGSFILDIAEFIGKEGAFKFHFETKKLMSQGQEEKVIKAEKNNSSGVENSEENNCTDKIITEGYEECEEYEEHSNLSDELKENISIWMVLHPGITVFIFIVLTILCLVIFY